MQGDRFDGFFEEKDFRELLCFFHGAQKAQLLARRLDADFFGEFSKRPFEGALFAYDAAYGKFPLMGIFFVFRPLGGEEFPLGKEDHARYQHVFVGL